MLKNSQKNTDCVPAWDLFLFPDHLVHGQSRWRKTPSLLLPARFVGLHSAHELRAGPPCFESISIRSNRRNQYFLKQITQNFIAYIQYIPAQTHIPASIQSKNTLCPTTSQGLVAVSFSPRSVPQPIIFSYQPRHAARVYVQLLKRSISQIERHGFVPRKERALFGHHKSSNAKHHH